MSRRQDTFRWRPIQEANGSPMPLVPISLGNGSEKTSTFDGMLDTGASLTIVHADWAAILGIPDLKSGKLQKVEGLGSGTAWGFKVDVTVQIGTIPILLNEPGEPQYVHFLEKFAWRSTMLIGHPHLAAWHRITFDAAGKRTWTTTRG